MLSFFRYVTFRSPSTLRKDKSFPADVVMPKDPRTYFSAAVIARAEAREAPASHTAPLSCCQCLCCCWAGSRPPAQFGQGQPDSPITAPSPLASGAGSTKYVSAKDHISSLRKGGSAAVSPSSSPSSGDGSGGQTSRSNEAAVGGGPAISEPVLLTPIKAEGVAAAASLAAATLPRPASMRHQLSSSVSATPMKLGTPGPPPGPSSLPQSHPLKRTASSLDVDSPASSSVTGPSEAGPSLDIDGIVASVGEFLSKSPTSDVAAAPAPKRPFLQHSRLPRVGNPNRVAAAHRPSPAKPTEAASAPSAPETPAQAPSEPLGEAPSQPPTVAPP